MKKLGHNIAKYLLKALMALFAALPLKLHYFNARILAWLAGSVIGYRRDDVMTNLARSFPDKKYDELRAIKKEFYRHFADLVVEAIWFGGCRNPKRLRRSRIVEIANPEEIKRVFELAPSVMVLYSHCGNWELYGGIENYNYSDVEMPVREDNFCVVYREMSSKVWDEIMRDNRFAPLKDRKNYPGYLESKDVIRYALKHRAEKKIYNMNTDQRPYFNSNGEKYLKLKFLNRVVETMDGGAKIAHKLGMAVCFLKMDIASRGHYRIEYVTICDDASKMSTEDIMKKYYSLLEEEINENPANYLWTHRRSYTNFTLDA